MPDLTIKVVDLDDCGCGCGGGDPHDAAVSEARLFEASIVGAAEPPNGDPICGTPVSLQVEYLKRQLADHHVLDFSVVSTDLQGLDDIERNAAIDAVVAGEPSPFVLVNGRVACAGSIELPAILEALGSTHLRARPTEH
jgi:hypothetical protein